VVTSNKAQQTFVTLLDWAKKVRIEPNTAAHRTHQVSVIKSWLDLDNEQRLEATDVSEK
jgi:hypothetical protein